MNRKEYAKHLGSLISGLEIDIENDDLSQEFYAYFQCFMPDGKNVEKVFEPLENGPKLLERLLPIYEITKEKTLNQFKEGVSPGYFCPDPIDDKELLQNLGKSHIENMISLSQFFKEEELETLLKNVSEIVISDIKIELQDDYLNSYLYDVVSDWGIDNEEDDALISILSEAFYAINCDYYLGYYFQFPSFQNAPKVDVLKSYFDIWKAGYYCNFDKEKLIIYKN